MSSPARGSMSRLKTLAWYSFEHPRLELDFGREEKAGEDAIHVFADSDRAGCPHVRRSTSGVVVVFCRVAINKWSSTQATVALSSGEAEYISRARAATEGLGVQALARDFGWKCLLAFHTDPVAAIGLASHLGGGRIRHIEWRVLWVQEALKCGRFRLEEILATENPADLSAVKVAAPLGRMGAALHSASWRERISAQCSSGCDVLFRMDP